MSTVRARVITVGGWVVTAVFLTRSAVDILRRVLHYARSSR